MVAPLREQLQGYLQEFNTGGKILAVITQDRVIDDNLKRQIKNRTLYNCRLFLPRMINILVPTNLNFSVY